MKTQNQLIKSSISSKFNNTFLNSFLSVLLRHGQSDPLTVAHLSLVPLYLKLSFYSNINKAILIALGGSSIYKLFYNVVDIGREYYTKDIKHITDAVDIRFVQDLVRSYPSSIDSLVEIIDVRNKEQAQLEFSSMINALSSVESTDQLTNLMVRSFNLVRLITETTKVTTSGLQPYRSNLGIHAYRQVEPGCIATSSSAPSAGLAALAAFLELEQFATLPMLKTIKVGLGSADTVFVINSDTWNVAATQLVELLLERTSKVVSTVQRSGLSPAAMQKRQYSTTRQAVDNNPMYELQLGNLTVRCFSKPSPQEWSDLVQMLNRELKTAQNSVRPDNQ
jgi:hypothetical protein